MEIDYAILLNWLNYMFRWLHIIAAMAWIGSSFFFIALDLGLRPAEKMPKGAFGDAWHVHGGGFYHMRKYLVAPEEMPQYLKWHKWQSYTTWLSGFGLMVIVYWLGGEIYLLDIRKFDIELWQGILISAGSLAFGWIFYDQLCKSRLGESPTTLMLILFMLLMAMSYAYNQVFSGRAALLHLGAFTATIMTANVFFQIIPNQRIVTADLRAGRTPDPKYGKIGKLRSTHNNYLTLPVIFLMLSVHYPLAFGTTYSWLIACLIFLAGVSIRHYFNTLHDARAAGEKGPIWTWFVTAGIIIIIVSLSFAGRDRLHAERQARAATHAHELKYIRTANFEKVHELVTIYCTLCHAREPLWHGISHAPHGVYLETPEDVARNARVIYLYAGMSNAMPPPAAIQIDDEARDLIVRWYREVNFDKVIKVDEILPDIDMDSILPSPDGDDADEKEAAATHPQLRDESRRTEKTGG